MDPSRLGAFVRWMLALAATASLLSGCGTSGSDAAARGQATLRLPDGAVQATWAPDGGKVAVPAHDRIELIRRDGGLAARVPVHGIDLSALSCECHVGWSAEGTELHLVTRPGETGAKSSVAVVGVNRSNPREQELGVHVGGAAWSPRGWPLVFVPTATVTKVGRPAPPTDLWRLDSLNAQPHKILHLPGEEFDPLFSPDGKRVLLTLLRRGSDSLWVTGIDGTGARRIVGGLLNPVASWSPDSSTIAFAAARRRGDRHIHMYLVPAGGGKIRQVVDGDVSDTAPAWSPNGRWIAYATESSLERVHPDGRGRASLLTREGELIRGLSWSPAGTPIAYASEPAPAGD